MGSHAGDAPSTLVGRAVKGGRGWIAAAPEGNYRLSIELKPASPADSRATIWAESRRLMLEGLRPGEHRTIAVNVRSSRLDPVPANAPGGCEVGLSAAEKASPDWDGLLSIDSGNAACPISVTAEPADIPTLYLAGDSTVTDQAEGPYASWGQMIPRFLGDGIAVANHAQSGETLKSFMTGLRLAKVLERMRQGDYLLIQFCHNDQKSEWLQTYAESGTTYKAYLRAYIAEARLRGATPILATSPQRRKFGADGRILNTHGAYPDAMREVAAEEGLVLVDFEAASRGLYEALGVEGSRAAFGVVGDETHHSFYGAYQLAKYAAVVLRGSGLPLASLVSSDLGDYEPSRPDDPASAPRPPAGGAEKPALRGY
jgi:lysophospholipase L1-like esterase